MGTDGAEPAGRKNQLRRLTMETRFKVGQWVRAKVTAQGMVEGATYQVVDVHTLWTVVGGVTSYLLADGAGETRWVGNGHLLLTEVK